MASDASIISGESIFSYKHPPNAASEIAARHPSSWKRVIARCDVGIGFRCGARRHVDSDTRVKCPDIHLLDGITPQNRPKAPVLQVCRGA